MNNARRVVPLLLIVFGAVRLPAAVCPSVRWTSEHVVATPATDEVLLLDYDGDAILDLVTGERGLSPGVYTRRGVGNGTFEAPVSRSAQAHSPALADITGDGIVDVLAAAGNGLLVLPGTGSGFGTAQSYPLGFGVKDIRAGNFDGDAANEVVVTGTDKVFAFLDNLNGQLVETQRVTLPYQAAAHGVADFDGDGHFDVVIPHVGAARVSIYFRTADGSFPAPMQLPLSSNPLRVAVGDVDGDGDPDFVTNDYAVAARALRIFRYTGSSGVRQFTQTTLPVNLPGLVSCCINSHGFLMQDVNGDGHLDLLTALINHATQAGVVTFAGVGDGTFRTPTYVFSRHVEDLVAADLDGDAAIDLLTVGPYDQSVFSRSCATQVFAAAETPFTTTQQAAIEVMVSGFGGTMPADRGTVTIDGVTEPADASGHWTVEVGPYPEGERELTASFSGNSELTPAVSEPFTVTSVSYGTVATVQTNGTQPVYGTLWPVTVTLTSTYARSTNTYTFDVDGVATTRNTSQGAAQLNLTPGPHTIRARYEGDANEPPSDWATLEVTALKATPSMTLHDSALAVRSGTAHVLHFTIGGSANTASPTGTVQILRDGAAIANATLANGEATVTLPLLPRGTYDVQAIYTGDSKFEGAAVAMTLQVTPNQQVAIDARGLTSAIQIGYVVPSNTQSITMFRRVVGAATWAVAGSWSAATGLDTGTLPRGVMHEYYLHAQLSNGTTLQSNVDRAMLFTDDPLATGTGVKSAHLLELQRAVNEMRAMAGLAPFAFDSSVAVSAPVRASHITGLRTAANQARSILGWSTPTFSPITAGVTILASHVQQLRDLAR